MSYTTLQKNLERIVKDRNYQITELERKAGLKKNNIYNIIKGISKKPSAELLLLFKIPLKVFTFLSF